MKYIRKLTPVDPYDIQGLESWLQDLALRGLYLKNFRPLFCTFQRGTPKAVRYRVDYCKYSILDGPPQDLLDLYRDFGWTYLCSAIPTLLIFQTDDPQAEEPHTDPSLQGELLAKLARKLRNQFITWLAELVFLVAATAALMLFSSPIQVLVVNSSFPLLAFNFFFIPSELVAAFREWRGVTRLVRQLDDGTPLTHQVRYPGHALHRLIGFAAQVSLLCLLLFFVASTLPSDAGLLPVTETDGFTPISLSTVEGAEYRPEPSGFEPVDYANFARHNSSLLCPDQWQVVQTGSLATDGQDWVRMEIHWYRPLFSPLAQPLAEDLLNKYRRLSSDIWWTAPEEIWDSWRVTEYAVDGLDWCAVAAQPGGGYQLAALSGNGRAVSVQYTGSGSLADHLDELAGMVA